MRPLPAGGDEGASRDVACLAIAALVLYGLRLGARDLWNPNEPIYGEAVREMAARGSWLVPYVNGYVFGEKPILYYWLALLSAKLCGGIGEVALRLPSLVAGVLTVLGVHTLVRPYAGRRRAIVAAIVAMTLFGVWWNARFVQMDILVTATTLFVIVAVTRVWDHGAAPRRGWILAGVVAGIGFLAKGPVAWVCPGLVLGAYAIATGRPREIARREVLWGAAAALAVALPWYLALGAAGRSDVLHEVLIRQNFARFVNPWDHARPLWYYLVYFWVDMAPWAFLVPLAWVLPRPREPERRLALLSWIWIAAIIVFFSLSKSKRSPYILPIAPATAVLAGEVLVAFAEDRLSGLRRRSLLVTFAGAAAVLAGLAGALLLIGVAKYPQFAAQARTIAATAIAGAIPIVVLLARPAGRRGIVLPAAGAAAIALVYAVLSISVLPALDELKSARPFCERARALCGESTPIASFNFWRWRSEFAFYFGATLRPIDGVAALRSAWERPEQICLVVEDDNLEAARAVLGTATPLLVRPIGGKAVSLFRNRENNQFSGTGLQEGSGL